MTTVHAKPSTLDLSQPGLDPTEAARRLAVVGPNDLDGAPRRPMWARFGDQFRNPLVAVLAGAVVLAAAVGDAVDAAVIALIVLANATLGFVQERKAERSLEALQAMLVAQARVRRGGVAIVVPAAEVVPGDVVLLEAGERIPADGRWLAAHELAVDESTLTGESIPVDKHAGGRGDSALGFMNTIVTRGRGELRVATTGMDTRMGRVAQLLRTTSVPPTPLQRQLDRLAARLVAVAGAAVAAVFVLGVARGGAITDEILHAVALAAAAIPEGLPAVVTVTLAPGARHLAGAGAIVKRLASVETLGATTVICSDKTGTLTLNQMTVRALITGGRRFRVTGEGYGSQGRIEATDNGGPADLRTVLLPLALCNDSRVDVGAIVGDPMEAALVVLATKGGVDPVTESARHPRLAELPFDAARRFMATFHADGNRVIVHAKGAPDTLLNRTDLDPEARAALLAEVDTLAGQGLRVLAAATGEIPAARFSAHDDLAGHVHGLQFQALVGIADPPRPEAREAVAACHAAGIAVKMITGDHATTAAAIAAELGIAGDVVTGAELDTLDDASLAARIDRVAVFARVAPEDKVRIVDALRARGEVVAMTGDGVNDAPALKRADIGVAMGRAGTEVSREAATMVLTDDNFATIVAAVHQGRAVYDNIIKFVRFQLTTNVGAITTLLGAALLGLDRPFDAVHVLWVNLVTDGPPGVALGVDPPAPGVMARPPRRPGDGILTGRRLRVVVLHAAVMAAGTLAVFAAANGEGPRATTLAFTTFVLFQVVNAVNVRREHGSVFAAHTLTNPRLWAALATVAALQVAAVHVPPLHGLFHTTTLSAGDWGVAAGTALSLLAVEEFRMRRRRCD